jgi:hypothetical protein
VRDGGEGLAAQPVELGQPRLEPAHGQVRLAMHVARARSDIGQAAQLLRRVQGRQHREKGDTPDGQDESGTQRHGV